MMKSLPRWVFVLVATLILSGCGDDPYALSDKDKAAFKDATPEIKQLWETALKADKANDYGTASTNYRTLLKDKLTPDQLFALQTALGGFNYRLNDAAAKGDKAAQKALADAKEAGPRR